MAEVDPAEFAHSVADTVKYYLGRTHRLLTRVAGQNDADRLLAIRLAPDMFDTGFQFALAIRFAGRALAPPVGIEVPNTPEAPSVADLLEYCDEIGELIDPLGTNGIGATVLHQAGEADLEQNVAGYMTCFALPNMLFHLSMAYAGLRHGGMRIGKADFDGFHVYRPFPDGQ